jgi:hypothetical protein
MTTELTPKDAEPKPIDTPTTSRPATAYRSSVTTRPDARLDGNSAVGRRVRDLFRAVMTRLGNPTDPMIVADCLALVELKAAAEVARAALLEGKVSSSNELVRLENLVRRAEARVGLEPGAATKTEPADWRDLFADELDEESGDGAEGAAR